MSSSSRLLVDVTQYSSWPATSGVQRVLQRLASEWAGEQVDADFGYIEGGSYATGPLRKLADVIRATFEAAEPTPAEEVRAALSDRVDGKTSTASLGRSYGVYLLPEPTFRRDVLTVCEELSQSGGVRPFFIYYDAIPLTHPEYFDKRTDADGSITRYHVRLARASHIAFISVAIKELFERRIARKALPHAIVARLGANGMQDGDAGVLPEVPTFVALGTVEPRKQHAIILDAFASLWAKGRDYRLVVIGAPGGGQPDVIERLARLDADGSLQWRTNADDDAVASALRSATAAIFVPSVEGYGLPPVEALALGCPVVASADVPALAGLGEAGQIRLETVTAQTVAQAVASLADPATNQSFRAAISSLDLPTWESFARGIEEWIAASLEAPASLI
jgi:glycosyltransferase involved in cell wall biosynthesis